MPIYRVVPLRLFRRPCSPEVDVSFIDPEVITAIGSKGRRSATAADNTDRLCAAGREAEVQMQMDDYRPEIPIYFPLLDDGTVCDWWLGETMPFDWTIP